MRLISILAGLFWGCAAPVIPDQRVAPISVPADVYRQTNADQKAADFPTDVNYFCPTGDQIKAMQTWVRARQHFDYIADAWDCDDMAEEWKVLTHRWAVENVTGKFPFSVATFVVHAQVLPEAFDWKLGQRGGHAIGLVIDGDGTLWYVEPREGWIQKVLEARYEDTIRASKIVW